MNDEMKYEIKKKSEVLNLQYHVDI
jgi:hypothetical protein